MTPMVKESAAETWLMSPVEKYKLFLWLDELCTLGQIKL